MADSDLHSNDQLVDAFLGLQLGGGLGLSIIVLTALGSQKVKRNATWYSFCLAWIISTISYTFIFLAGQQDSPNFGVCVTQAAGIYSAPSLTSCGTLAFAIDMLFGVRAASLNIAQKRKSSTTLALLITPYTIWLILFVGMLVYGLKNPAMVQKVRLDVFHSVQNQRPSLRLSGQSTQMTIRIMIFSLMGALGLGVGITYVLFSKQGPAFDIILACIPACGAVIFGSQTDLLNVWLFWREPRVSEFDGEKTPSVVVPTPRFEIY
ncbi:hypothetical protein B0H10DRAFT_325342 [Mycena sp. CBHHK59/15]|nr:hypothetical protein B0H10DRAFT_325342 [Mycena sp. CBHHK59/15]